MNKTFKICKRKKNRGWKRNLVLISVSIKRKDIMFFGGPEITNISLHGNCNRNRSRNQRKSVDEGFMLETE